MKQARIAIDKYAVLSEVDPRVYGSFIEHLGRAVYEGIYQPGQPSADEEGFRTDTLALIREIGVPVVRYPGGNFVSGFRWEDSVGPRELRPRRLDYAWRTTETNAFGLHEFMSWCKKANTSPMMAVNLGTRGMDEARALLEYCNHPAGCAMSDLRVANGQKEPFNIRLWCLGNEMDGPWQMGHKTAHEYGRIANETSALMKRYDPTIETVVCGSSHAKMPTFGEWEREVLTEAYNSADYISLHTYWDNDGCDTPDFLAKTVPLDDFISAVTATCDHVKALKRSRKTVNLSLDEWNVWHRTNDEKPTGWPEHPHQLENTYTLEDALLVGSALITILRHADRVKIACMAQLVNVIAPIMTSNTAVWRQTTFYPYMHASTMGRGKVLRTTVIAPTYACKYTDAAPYLDAVVTEDEAAGTLTVFALNKSPDEAMELRCDLRQYADYRVTRHVVLTGDLKAVNTEQNPLCVVPREGGEAENDNGDFTAVLPAGSWNVIRLSRQ